MAGNQEGGAQEDDGLEAVLQVVAVQGDAPGVAHREVVAQADVLFPAIALVGRLRLEVAHRVVFGYLEAFRFRVVELAAQPRPEVVNLAGDHRVDFPELVESLRKGGDSAENRALRHPLVAFQVDSQASKWVYRDSESCSVALAKAFQSKGVRPVANLVQETVQGDRLEAVPWKVVLLKAYLLRVCLQKAVPWMGVRWKVCPWKVYPSEGVQQTVCPLRDVMKDATRDVIEDVTKACSLRGNVPQTGEVDFHRGSFRHLDSLHRGSFHPRLGLRLHGRAVRRTPRTARSLSKLNRQCSNWLL